MSLELTGVCLASRSEVTFLSSPCWSVLDWSWFGPLRWMFFSRILVCGFTPVVSLASHSDRSYHLQWADGFCAVDDDEGQLFSLPVRPSVQVSHWSRGTSRFLSHFRHWSRRAADERRREAYPAAPSPVSLLTLFPSSGSRCMCYTTTLCSRVGNHPLHEGMVHVNANGFLFACVPRVAISVASSSMLGAEEN